ncbi:hypothetical protein WDU94_000398 [Cyamophila willieti]
MSRFTKFKPSANLSFLWPDVGPLYMEKYQLADKVGFTFIESMFPPRDVTIEMMKEAQTQYGLSQVLINTEADENFGYAAVKGKEAEFQASFNKTLQYAEELRIKNIHVMAGKVLLSSEEDSQVAYNTMRDNLSWACGRVNRTETEIKLLIEPINRYSIPNYFLSDYDTALRLISELNNIHHDDIVKLQLDFFHAQMICGDLTHLVERCRGVIGHVQIAQAPHRQEPQGPGEINYKYIFDLLKRVNYEGYVGLEYKPTPGIKTTDGLLNFRQTYEEDFQWDKPQ